MERFVCNLPTRNYSGCDLDHIYFKNMNMVAHISSLAVALAAVLFGSHSYRVPKSFRRSAWPVFLYAFLPGFASATLSPTYSFSLLNYFASVLRISTSHKKAHIILLDSIRRMQRIIVWKLATVYYIRARYTGFHHRRRRFSFMGSGRVSDDTQSAPRI